MLVKQQLQEQQRKQLEKQKTQAGYESSEDEDMKALKKAHKQKTQNLSAAARKVIDQERERAIELYRARKAQKMSAAGLTPLSK